MTAGSKGKRLLAHYHVNIKRENRMDLEEWQRFLTTPDVFCR